MNGSKKEKKGLKFYCASTIIYTWQQKSSYRPGGTGTQEKQHDKI